MNYTKGELKTNGYEIYTFWNNQKVIIAKTYIPIWHENKRRVNNMTNTQRSIKELKYLIECAVKLGNRGAACKYLVMLRRLEV